MATWPLIALASSMLLAGMFHLNHVLKVPGESFVLWRGPWIALFSLPFLVFVPLPTSLSFYLGALLIGLTITVADVILFNAAARFGGRLTSLYMCLRVFLLFALWALLQPGSLDPLMSAPWKFVVVLLCFTVSAWAVISLRRNDASRAAILFVMPAALFLAIENIIAKLILPPDISLGATLQLLMLSTLFSSLFLWMWLTWRRRFGPPQVPLSNQKHIALLSFSFLATVGSLYMALVAAPNPGYVSAILLLATVWLALAYRLLYGDLSSLWSSAALIASSLVLILVTT